MQPRGTLSRRGFVRRSTGAIVAAGLPLWFARHAVAQADGAAAKKPGEKFTLGIIGTGSRGLAVMDEMKAQGGRFVAVCDVDTKHLDQGAEKAGNGAAKFRDFRELLDRKDLDAVAVVTPDHWHALVAIEAMKHGKDVYCEKPLALTISEGQAMVKAARGNDRVFQTGSQQRSDARFRLACELVRNGRIGKIKTVETRIGSNPKEGPFPVEPVPAELDWNFWQGPVPEVEYVTKRAHYEFRWWYEYSGGKVTDWGAHHNDIAQWGLGTDGTGPVEVVSECDQPTNEPNSYNCPPHFKITYTYGSNASPVCDGTKLVCTDAGENGIRFEGENGWIFVSREKIDASDKKILDEPLPNDAIRLEVSEEHRKNFFECMESRKRPICDVEIGHRSVNVCHIGNISLRLGGKKLQWDPVKERFIGDSLANEMLSRPMRAPWKLEA